MATKNDKWYRVDQVQSSNSKTLYTVGIDMDTGKWGCSCRGWTRWRKDCKHINLAKARNPFASLVATAHTNARAA